MAGIGSLNESALHAALKVQAAPPGSRFEVRLGGYIVDAVAGDLVIEVQTGNLGAMRSKLASLLAAHRVRLVLPVAETRWIVRELPTGAMDRRRSPIREGPLHIFAELVSAPTLLANPNLEIEIVLTEVEELRHHAPGRAWRRHGWVIEGRRLLGIRERHLLRHPADLMSFVPRQLPTAFTTADLTALAGIPRRLAQQAVYCLLALDLVERIGRSRRGHVYRIASSGDAAGGSAGPSGGPAWSDGSEPRP